jgi:hypothetical protein
MLDLGIPYTSPIPMGEDNSTTWMIAHGYRLSPNVRHIGVQTRILQSFVEHGDIVLGQVGTHSNLADHLTKILPRPAFMNTTYMMGLRFLTALHYEAVNLRNKVSSERWTDCGLDFYFLLFILFYISNCHWNNFLFGDVILTDDILISVCHAVQRSHALFAVSSSQSSFS